MERRSRKRAQIVLYPTPERRALLERLAERLGKERGGEPLPMTETVWTAVEKLAAQRGVAA